MRGMKRPHDMSSPGWPAEAKRPAVVTDYPSNSARYFSLMLEIKRDSVK